MNPESAIRKVEKITGCKITTIQDYADGKWFPVAFAAHDPELDSNFLSAVRRQTKEQILAAIKRLHAMVYRARREELYARQRGRCSRCDLKTQHLTCHHKKHRAVNGRDDRLSNMELLCTGPGTNGCHDAEHS